MKINITATLRCYNYCIIDGEMLQPFFFPLPAYACEGRWQAAGCCCRRGGSRWGASVVAMRCVACCSMRFSNGTNECGLLCNKR